VWSELKEDEMWFREYRDYRIDRPLIKEKVEPGKGIIGCEMHDLNGWGLNHHKTGKRKKSLWSRLMTYWFNKRNHS
jgi:hypothetical protein